MKWHKTCKCKCRLDARVCKSKQRWNEDKCRYECKELTYKGIFDKGFILNPSNCECECDKSCNIGELLGYKSCKCRNKIVDKLLEECSKNIDGNKMVHNETLNEILLNAVPLDAIPLNVYKKMCNFCTIYIVLLAIFFITSICISSVFIYFY